LGIEVIKVMVPENDINVRKEQDPPSGGDKTDVQRRRRFVALWDFFRGRFSSRYLGLHLTMGVLIFIGACWLFGAIAEDVVTGDLLTITDKHVAEWLHHHATPGLTAAMQVITDFASPFWVIGASVVIGLVLWWKRCWYRLLALVLAIQGGMAQLPLLKMAFRRHRPSFDDAFLIFQDYSFPSGHTLAATLLYGLLAVFAFLAFDTWPSRVLAVLGAFVMVLLAGFSRLYLGAHYLSDVLGGVAAGVAWLALSFTLVDTLRRSRDRLI
jgi:undecaprenyl-diphosphatase